MTVPRICIGQDYAIFRLEMLEKINRGNVEMTNIDSPAFCYFVELIFI